MLRFLLLPTVILCGFSDYTPYTYPDSMTQSELCGQMKPSFFCDPNNIVSRRKKEGNGTLEEKNSLDNELLYVRGETNCSCVLPTLCMKSPPRGFTISIAVVEKMHLDNNETSRDSILQAAKIFADVVRDRQNRGQCDDDLIIFLSARDQVVYTSIGSAIRIDDSDIKRISEQGEIFFKKMLYREGLEWMTRQYKHALRAEKLEKLWNWPLPEWVLLVLAVLVLIVLASLICTTIYLCIRFCRRDRRDEYSMVEH
uniref:VWFA domain-containing protein n=2 Tax=Caenorhabditis tropicalis TaxID=1561998 RepID=A0A1I7UVS7_9PELO